MESEVYFIYAGKRLRGGKVSYKYFIAGTLEQNDGRSVENMREFNVNSAMWKTGTGAMHKATLVNEQQVKFTKNIPPSGYWKNTQDRALWELEEAPVKVLAEIKKGAGVNNLAEILKPIRDTYYIASQQERTAILAEVIRLITKSY